MIYWSGSMQARSIRWTSRSGQVAIRGLGHKSTTTLDLNQAAALPLTAITAWEALFDRFQVSKDSTGTLLILGAAGGVGSMLVQLAARLTVLTVIGTASRPESQRWVTEMGADQVINHHGDLARNVHGIAPDGIDYLFSPYSTGNVDAFAEVMRPHSWSITGSSEAR